MRPFLLARDGDLDLERALPGQAEELVQDLGLESVFQAMAAGDDLILQVSRQVLLSSLREEDAILYRQEILRDCLLHPTTVQELYHLAGDTLTAERNVYRSLFSRRPVAILQHGVGVLELTIGSLRRLRAIADREATAFRSEGFRSLFATLRSELGDSYLLELEEHLAALRLRHGLVMSARLGLGNRGASYTLRRPPTRGRGWRELLPLPERDAFTFEISPRDESGATALGELQDRGLNRVADALGRSTDHILGFFRSLRNELSFYIGCLNLQERLAARDVVLGFPEPALGPSALRARGLHDLVLVLESEAAVVPNDLDADERPLVVITGANQGGKSTFLRSVGTAQLLLQAGMFVPGEVFRSTLATSLFTHYKREEDAALESGKLDEELSRMSEIVDAARSGAMVLCNESFAATNEREGSEIGRQVIGGLLDSNIRVLLVTHLFELASTLRTERGSSARFLRAERAADGTRSHHLRVAEPLATSFGEDLYGKIFQEQARAGQPVAAQRS